MTRGREGEWIDTPLAQWLRQQLARKEWTKKRLAAELVARLGSEQETKERQVGRWTYEGQPETGGSLSRASVEALTEIFGSAPPGANDDRRPIRIRQLEQEMSELRARLDAVEAQLTPQEQHPPDEPGGVRPGALASPRSLLPQRSSCACPDDAASESLPDAPATSQDHKGGTP